MLRMVHPQLIEKPVIQRTVVFELQRANGMGDTFDRILEAVSPIVHGIDAPLIACAVML